MHNHAGLRAAGNLRANKSIRSMNKMTRPPHTARVPQVMHFDRSLSSSPTTHIRQENTARYESQPPHPLLARSRRDDGSHRQDCAEKSLSTAGAAPSPSHHGPLRSSCESPHTPRALPRSLRSKSFPDQNALPAASDTPRLPPRDRASLQPCEPRRESLSPHPSEPHRLRAAHRDCSERHPESHSLHPVQRRSVPQ